MTASSLVPSERSTGKVLNVVPFDIGHIGTTTAAHDGKCSNQPLKKRETRTKDA